VTIRLLDPPLHEFLPHSEAEIADVAASLGVDAASMQRRRGRPVGSNPMLAIAAAASA
jgi:pyruvate,orthophosphate dikinase